MKKNKKKGFSPREVEEDKVEDDGLGGHEVQNTHKHNQKT